MKLLNKLVGSDILDLVSQDLNKDILRLAREQKSTEESLESTSAELVEVETIKAVKETKLVAVKEAHRVLVELGEKYNNVNGITDQAILRYVQIDAVKKLIKVITPPAELPQLKELALKLKEVLVIHDQYVKAHQVVMKTDLQLKDVVIPEGIEENKVLAVRFKEIRAITSNHTQLAEQISRLIPLLDTLKADSDALRLKYKRLLKDFGKCPLCHSVATPELLERIEI